MESILVATRVGIVTDTETASMLLGLSEDQKP